MKTVCRRTETLEGFIRSPGSIAGANSPREGASMGEEAVSADSGREGEIVARVERVRSLGFLSILQGVFSRLLSQADWARLMDPC